MLVALAAFAVYASSFRSPVSVDASTYVLLSYSFVRDGDANFDEYAADRASISYWSQEIVAGHTVGPYQPGAAMFAAPFAALGVLVGIQPPSPASVLLIGKLAAAVAGAGSVLFVFLACALVAGRRIATIASVLYAFGTITWPVSGTTLWQHGPAQLFVAAGMFLLLRSGPLWGERSGLFFGLAALTRHTGGLSGLAAAYTALRRGRSAFLRLAAWSLPAIALKLMYDLTTFGTIVTRFSPYSTSGGDRLGSIGDELQFSLRADPGSIAVAALGLLISPSRGLLTYSPFLALGAYELARRLRGRGRLSSVLRPQVAAVLVMVAVYSTYRDWWGGFGYGGRFLAESLPILVLGTALWARRHRRSRYTAPVLAVTGTIAVLIAGLGATVYDWTNWSWEKLAPSLELVWRLDIAQPLYTAIHASEHWDATTPFTVAVLLLALGVIAWSARGQGAPLVTAGGRVPDVATARTPGG